MVRYAPSKMGVEMVAKLRRKETLREVVGRMKPDDAIEHLLYLVEAFVPSEEEVLSWSLPGVHLTPIQKTLTLALARHPGRLFSTEQIMVQLYGENMDTAPDDKIVKVLLSHLRRKLTPLGFVFETVWGMGYRLHVPENVKFPWSKTEEECSSSS